MKQIYSITTNNGANAVKSCNLSSEAARVEQTEDECSGAICISDDDTDGGTDSDEEESVNTDTDESSNANLAEEKDIAEESSNANLAEEKDIAIVVIVIDDAVTSISQQCSSEDPLKCGIASVRCGVHTLQLAVNDVLKKS